MNSKRNDIDFEEINSTLVQVTPRLLLGLLFIILILPGVSLLAGFNLGFNSHLHSIDYFYLFIYRWAITVIASLIVILAMVDFLVNRQEVVFTVGLAYLFLAYFNTLFIIYHDWVYATSQNLENLHAFIWFVSNALTALILCFGLNLLLFKLSLKAKIYCQLIFFIIILIITSSMLHLFHLGHYHLERFVDNSPLVSKILALVNLLFYLYLIFLQYKLTPTHYLFKIKIFLYLGIIQCAMSCYILFDIMKHFDASYVGSSFLQLLCYFVILFTLIARYFYSYVSILATQKTIVEEKYKFQQLSTQDPLTHLLNRRAFEIAVEKYLVDAEKQLTSFALLFLDINDFKTINDTLGHHVGDRLLQQVATRIQSVLAPHEIIARLGGDEFAGLITTSDTMNIVTCVTELDTELSMPYLIEQHNVSTSVSVGYALYPVDGLSIQTLLKKADSAMYKMKKNRKRLDLSK